MAERPAFFVDALGPALVRVEAMDFTWFAGMAMSRKQMSMRSLHQSIQRSHPSARILEISRMSDSMLGERLSAFNLSFRTPKTDRTITVECAFQASKVFEEGGPFVDLLEKSPIEAKRDPRLSESGRLLGFCFFGDHWPNEPPTAFYDWIYINALVRQPELAQAVADYDVFTDIAFNPGKSINCQANSVALYVSLVRRGRLEKALSSKSAFLDTVRGRARTDAKDGQATLF